MPFTVEPKAPETPAAPQASVVGGVSSSQQAARARAMARLTGEAPPATQAAPQQQVVQNQNAVSGEELGAIIPKFSQSASAETGQNGTTVDSAQEATQNTPADPAAAAAQAQPLSPQFAQLARKEKAVRAQQAELKRAMAEFKAAQDAAKAPPSVPQMDASKYVSIDDLQKNALGTLAKLGLSYDKLTEQAVNAPSAEQVAHDNTIEALREEIKALRQGQDDVNKSIKDQQTQAYEETRRSLKQETNRIVRSQPDQYEMIKSTDSHDDVVELIEKTFFNGLDEDYPKGTVLTVEEAAQIVEDHLVEEATRLAKLQKIQKRLQPAAASQTAPATGQQATKSQSSDPKQPQLKTLTNSVGSSRQYTLRERAMFAAQHGPNWREKVGG